MILLLAALSTRLAITEPQDGAEQLPDLFAAACLDGAVRMGAGDAAEISLGDLPAVLQRRIGKPRSVRVWSVTSPAPAFLYVANYDAGQSTSPSVCGVASKRLPINAAAELMEKRLGGPCVRNLHQTIGTIELINADDGYSAQATMFAGYTVMELKRWTDKQQREALDVLSWMKHRGDKK